MSVVSFDPIAWITPVLLALLQMGVTCHLLANERQKRRSGSATLTTASLRRWSLLCIAFAPAVGLCVFLQYFQGFCYFAHLIHHIAGPCQAICMGFFHLSRLFYCFSSSQTYSANGYSQLTFAVMYCLGVAILIYIGTFHVVTGEIRLVCGIDKHSRFFMAPFSHRTFQTELDKALSTLSQFDEDLSSTRSPLPPTTSSARPSAHPLCARTTTTAQSCFKSSTSANAQQKKAKRANSGAFALIGCIDSYREITVDRVNTNQNCKIAKVRTSNIKKNTNQKRKRKDRRR